MFDFLNKDKAIVINFLFRSTQENNKRLTWDDLDTLEKMREGETTSIGMKNLVARFMADGKNVYMPHEKAIKILGKLSSDEITDVISQFTSALQNAAVSPMSGSALNLTQKVGSEETLPVGSQS
jgi:hypothetical protein